MRQVEHHAALPNAAIGGLHRGAAAAGGVDARALEFADPDGGAEGRGPGRTWSEIDLAKRVWTVPAARMKAEKEQMCR